MLFELILIDHQIDDNLDRFAVHTGGGSGFEDRHQGVYSGGAWLAIARGSALKEGVPRSTWVLSEGPSAGDLTAAMFWRQPPDWIGVGSTPDIAVADLIRNLDDADAA